MLGAIAGDIIGSVYEGKKQWLTVRTTDFEPLFSPKARFPDDTVLTVAVYGAMPYQWPGSDAGTAVRTGLVDRPPCSWDNQPVAVRSRSPERMAPPCSLPIAACSR
jgi:hypothetical protein